MKVIVEKDLLSGFYLIYDIFIINLQRLIETQKMQIVDNDQTIII